MIGAGPLRALALAGALAACPAAPAGPTAAAAAGPSPAAAPPAARRDPSRLTLKERSGGKAADEQRVDDCKVPFAQRGDHHRPSGCARR